MPSYFVVCYIISLTLSVITLFIGIYVGKSRLHVLKILPKALRWHLIVNCYLYFFLTSLFSTYISVYFLIFNTDLHYTVDFARFFISFASQQNRIAFILMVFERIVATVKLETYKTAKKFYLFLIMTVLSYATSAFYIGIILLGKYSPNPILLYSLVNYYIYFAHIFMLSVCGVLYLLNRRMYKLSAYRITLKRRYTIAQNIKCLKYLFPLILIYAVFAQFGSMNAIIFQAFNFPTPPVAIYHTFFNLSFLLIYLWHYFMISAKIILPHTSRIAAATAATTVQNPLGKNIPTNVTSNQYFHNLKHQWK